MRTQQTNHSCLCGVFAGHVIDGVDCMSFSWSFRCLGPNACDFLVAFPFDRRGWVVGFGFVDGASLAITESRGAQRLETSWIKHHIEIATRPITGQFFTRVWTSCRESNIINIKNIFARQPTKINGAASLDLFLAHVAMTLRRPKNLGKRKILRPSDRQTESCPRIRRSTFRASCRIRQSRNSIQPVVVPPKTLAATSFRLA
jgi:hypothetical protein